MSQDDALTAAQAARAEARRIVESVLEEHEEELRPASQEPPPITPDRTPPNGTSNLADELLFAAPQPTDETPSASEVTEATAAAPPPPAPAPASTPDRPETAERIRARELVAEALAAAQERDREEQERRRAEEARRREDAARRRDEELRRRKEAELRRRDQAKRREAEALRRFEEVRREAAEFEALRRREEAEAAAAEARLREEATARLAAQGHDPEALDPTGEQPLLEATIDHEAARAPSGKLKKWRWLVASILGAIAIAVLFPLAIEALRALVQLS